MNGSGGMELLFDDKRSHRVSVPSVTPSGAPSNVSYLIHWVRDNLLKERVELFMEGETVLVLLSSFALGGYSSDAHNTMQASRNPRPHQRR